MTKGLDVSFGSDRCESDAESFNESQGSSNDTDVGLPSANPAGGLAKPSCLRRTPNHIDQAEEESCSELNSIHTNSRRKFLKVEFTGMSSEEEEDDKHSDADRDLYQFHRKGITGIRLREPRLSLLGKPINYRAHKRDVRYRRAQAKVYNFLERPTGWKDIVYHMAV